MTEAPNTSITPEQEAPEVIEVPKGYERAIKLGSGKIVAIRKFQGKDVMEIIRQSQAAKKQFDPGQMQFYIIAMCCLYDGKKLHLDDLKTIDGFDLLELMAEFQGK